MARKHFEVKPTDDQTSVMFNVGTKTYGDMWATVSIDDWQVLRHHTWSATRRRSLFYVRNGACKLIHRVIMNPPEGLVVDHIDGDPLNNRRSNLRLCTLGENTSFAADARRGGPKPKTVLVPTKAHVVKKVLADGTIKEYRYKTRSMTGQKLAFA